MELSPRTKKVVQVSSEALRFALQWGFVPFVIYLGFSQGSDPMPNGEVVPMTLSSLLWG